MTTASIPRYFALGRRDLLAAASAAIAAVPAPTPARATSMTGIPASGQLRFDVFRNDSRIGIQHLDFQTAGQALTVRTATDLKVGLGPITLFRYSLRTVEHWQGGQLVAAASKGDNNGTAASMSASLEGGALAVKGSKSGAYVAPRGAILATHWNRAELDGPSINPENGELMRFTVTPRGSDQIEAAGQRIEAECYALSGPATIDLWYSREWIWSGLQAVASDNSRIDYRLT